MAIHHAVLKRAEKMKVTLVEDGTHEWRYTACWTKGKEEICLAGSEAKHLLDDVSALHQIDRDYASFRWAIQDDQTVTMVVKGTNIQVEGLRAAAAFAQVKKAWMESRAELDEDDEEADAEVQAEIDAEVEEEKADSSGSVVSPRYRALYAERGHPNHCGDWLADLLVNICTNDSGINIELFESICAANGVDLSGYKHEGQGWQGRLRMTGRNLLAKRVYFAEGKLVMPDEIEGGKVYTAPDEWMAAQNFKAPTAKKAAKAA